jgi:hypothetical protein
MYALLDESDNLVAGKPIEIYRVSRAITLPDGLQLPGNWMQLLSIPEKALMHIFPLQTTTFDKHREYNTGASTFTFDGSMIYETIITAPLPEPEGLDRYKQVAYVLVDNMAQVKITEAENTPTVSEDYADDSIGKQRADLRRNNRAKSKVPISDADDNLFDHIDKVYDGADLIRDAIEVAADYDAVDAILLQLDTDSAWPTWTPL